MNATCIRTLVIGTASLVCLTMASSARAELPGDGGRSRLAEGVTSSDAFDLQCTWQTSTCFLSGISGTLYGGAVVTVQAASQGPKPDWTLSMQPGDYPEEIGGEATCVNTPPLNFWSIMGSGSKTMASTANGTQCFLSGFTQSGAWLYDGAQATISIIGSNWVLQTSGFGSDALIQAVCFEAPNAKIYMENRYSGTFNVPLEETSQAPVACGLRGISGSFQGGWSDGVDMNWPSSDPGTWSMTATNGKIGWLTCLQ
jgi:hypothetical protein